MKICIAGIGGVGGYLGGALARKFAGSDEDQVYFVARGARKEAILKDGITVESDLLGTFTAKPFGVGESDEQLGQMDVIFICVKNYSLEAVCNQIRDMVREDTVVVTVMNGVDPAKRAAAYLGKGIVLDSMIYIVAGSRPDFSVKQSGDYCDVHISGREPEAAAKVQARLKEACSVARKLGVKIADDLEAEHYRHFMVEQSEAATSSLRRDMDAGRPNELETFSGYLLRTAEGLGMELPVSKRFYEGLKARSAN